MANLLPPDAKNALRSARTAHLVAFGAAALLASAALTFFALLPSYITLKMQEVRSTKSNEAQSAEVAASKKDLAHTQGLVVLLAPIATSTSFLGSLGALLGDRPPGAHVESISYTKNASDKKGQIIVSGASASRENINTFRIALEKDSHFDSVVVPINALTGAEEGHFTITVKGAF